MDTISPSSSSSSTHQWKYDVFLSFRGGDTRNSFTDHLYAALKQKGIYTFRDDEKLERGEPISPVLLKAIEDSLFAIVVLSKNYASSTWCLDELVKIMDCRKNMGLIVLPIFYDVEPSVVRKQTETYAQAFAEHEKRFNKNLKKVQMWRAALTDVSNLSGWSLEDRPEAEFIQGIIKVISLKLSLLFPKDTNGLVGIDSRVEELMSLLAIGSSDVRIIGIWGMGGIGKTTLARVVYDKVFNEFEGGCFITNVRGGSEKCELLLSQQKLICDILMEKSVNIRDVDDGVLKIKNRLCHKRVLLVLDDVNHFNQLEKLAGDFKWFGPGSRVIITTRDEHLLRRHNVYGIYRAQELDDYEALHLFSLKAFNTYYPPEDCRDLSTSFVDYAKGLPLAIDVLGSLLYKRSREEWECALDRVKEFPEESIIKILQISFDGLHETEREIFLHIACYLNMKDKDYIVDLLDCLGLYPKLGLKILIEKSLLKDYENKYWMHDLLQIMGQDIVRRDYPEEPGKWSRLWVYKDIRRVLMRNTEIEAIRGLFLELGELHKSETVHWNLEAFSKMPNLKLLIIQDDHLLHGPKNLPNGLRYLEWSRYRGRSLPSSFESNEIVGLSMCHSKIIRLWKGVKHYGKLKSIKLNDSLNLIATPNVTGVPNLKKLVFEGCINLCEVDPSILVHERLTLLNLGNCKSLSSLPNKFETKSLEILILSGCSKIEIIPEFIENMEQLSILHLDGTAITQLPSTVKHLTNLASLNLRDCKNLVCLPSIICNFKSLKDIRVAGCLKLDNNLPENLWNNSSLEVLDVSGITIRELPLLSFPSLVRLNLSDCNIVTIPIDFGYLPSIECLDLSGNYFDCLPKSIIQLSRLLAIYLRNCTRIRSLPQLPSTTSCVYAKGCTSLETLPNILKLFKLHQPRLYLFNCFKLAENQGWTDIFIRFLSRYAQGIYKAPVKPFPVATLSIVIPGSEIPRWFSHQSAGVTVNAHVTRPGKNVNMQVPSHPCNKWIGMAVCIVFSVDNLHSENVNLEARILISCEISINNPGLRRIISFLFDQEFVQMESDHLWLLFLHPESFNEDEREQLSQIDEDGFLYVEVLFDFEFNSCFVGKKCGFHMVYERDIEEIREMMAQSSNSSCIVPYEGLRSHVMPVPSNDPYEGIDAEAQHDFDNSMVATESNSNGAGLSGEGSSNDVPHPRRIQIPHPVRIIKKVWKILKGKL